MQFLPRTPLSALVPQQLQGGFRKPVFVGASPTRGSIFQGRDVTVSISACDADCAGANPVALTISFLMGRSSQVIAPTKKGWLLTAREPLGESLAMRVRVPLAKPRICGATCPSDHPVVQLRENTWVQPGRCGFDSHRECHLRRAVEYGLSVKREIASGFEPRPSRNSGWVSISPLVRRYLKGPTECRVTASAIWRRSSVVEHPSPIREVAGSSPVS